MAPLRRSDALRPLSSDHHRALLLAFRAKHAAEGRATAAGPGDPRAVVRDVIAAFDAELDPHFATEELLLAPVMQGAGLVDERRRLHEEHAALRTIVDALRNGGDVTDGLARFSVALEQHVRWEERALFGRLEAALEGPALDVLGEAIAARATPAACATGAKVPGR